MSTPALRQPVRHFDWMERVIRKSLLQDQLDYILRHQDRLTDTEMDELLLFVQKLGFDRRD
jgi:hypothetical protein